jgi:hypothetical protein
VQDPPGACPVSLGWAEETTQEASHVDIQERLDSPIHDGQHRARSIGADTRQTFQLLSRAGYDASTPLDRQRELLECQRLLPPESEGPEGVLELFRRRLREGGPRWAAIHKPWIGPRNPGRGSPLQQNFRDDDFVGRPVRLAPGKGAAAS